MIYSRTLVRFTVVLIVLAGIAFVVLGCLKPTVVQRGGIQVIDTFDTSGSDRKALSGFVSMSLPTLMSLDPTRDQLHMFRLDCSLRQFHDGPPIIARDRLVPLLSHELAPQASGPETAFDQYWRATDESVTRAEKPTVVVLYSDCCPDGMTPNQKQAIRASINHLASAPNLAGFAVVGVRDIAWAGLNADLAPIRSRLGADHTVLVGEHDLDATPVRQLLNRVREEHTMGRKR